MERQLGGGVAARCTRVAAYAPADLDAVLKPGALEAAKAAGRSPEELACLASHLEAVRLAAASAGPASEGDEWAIIAEDDIVLPLGPYDERLLGADAPRDADLLQLTCVSDQVYAADWTPGGPEGLWRPWAAHMYGTQMYAVRLAAAPARLRALGLDPGRPLVKSWWVRGGENTREAARTLARVGDARVFGP